MNLWCWK